MKHRKTTILLGAVMVAALLAGGVLTAWAVPADAPAERGLGLKMGSIVRDGSARLVDIVADLTGKSIDEVVAAREEGASFAEIASQSGVSPDAVISAAVAPRAEALAALVASGDATQEQADRMLANLEARVTDRVNSVNPGCTGDAQGCGGGACGEGSQMCGGSGAGEGARRGGKGQCGGGGCSQ